MIRIGFDGKRAVQNFTGLGNYSRYVLEALQAYYPKEELTIYAPKKVENKRLNPILEKENVKLCTPRTNSWKKLRSIWRIWGIMSDLEKDDIELFHGLSNELPLNIHKQNHIKSIVTIHDLIFRRLPQCYKPIDRLIYDYKFRKACQHADKIIAVSECTKQDIVKDYHISPDKIEVIYQGCDPVFAIPVTQDKKKEVSKRYQLPANYLLFVGSIEERKNALLAIQALEHLPENLHLVLVGKKTPYVDLLTQKLNKQTSQRVHFLHDVPFADLPCIYQIAQVFVYPSRYEGFGIPILEALNSRVPVIAATGSCLEEAGGPHSLYVHPDNIQEMVEAIRKALQPEIRTSMIENGYQWAAQFTQEQMAHQTMACYRRTLENN